MVLKMRKNRTPPPAPSCALTECMSLLRGAWTPNIIWHLSAGPRRFGELRTDLSSISAKVLSGRLRDLEAKRVVVRSVMPTSPPSVEYALTELGKELVAAIQAVVKVAERLKSQAASAAETGRLTESGARRNNAF
ncbi:helix-turn-helix domain-containing protein [Bradyrhizobium sp. AUGA SZCCT0177]|uniref:winged helix-turn-helix transcriptional regulator n=1 Tax=Bradyrhizobium sp. AUGA SZCCT0177 TaxID=2807665 RepID=UPI001BA7A39E|nr:helix-turn-helix domain-containing protein [Bradyrhizobium sp. AUGA SZCCT0177]